MNDDVVFLNEDDPTPQLPPWNILIVDDEPDVHHATTFALQAVTVRGRRLVFHSCYRGIDAVQFLLDTQDQIHLMLLDAVMESANAGIECARQIKVLFKMEIPIIVMRSGFAPGMVEEEMERHGYLAEFLNKTEATQDKLIEVLERWLPEADK